MNDLHSSTPKLEAPAAPALGLAMLFGYLALSGLVHLAVARSVAAAVLLGTGVLIGAVCLLLHQLLERGKPVPESETSRRLRPRYVAGYCSALFGAFALLGLIPPDSADDLARSLAFAVTALVALLVWLVLRFRQRSDQPDNE